MKLFLAWCLVVLIGGALIGGFITLLIFDTIAMLFSIGVIALITAFAWAIVTVTKTE